MCWQSQNKTALILMNCSLGLLSDDPHHQLSLFSHSMSHIITPPENNRFPVRISNYIDAFPPCECALQFGQLALLYGWTLLWLALLITPLVMRCGCGIYPHFWQIMLLNWLLCQPLHRVSNCVDHPHGLCSVWDPARRQCNAEYLSLACAIGKASTTLSVNSVACLIK